MKRIFLYTSIISLFSVSLLYSQTTPDYGNIKASFESFNFPEVIELSDTFIGSSTAGKDTLIDVMMMKAIAHFSLGEEAMVRKSFIEILKIDKNYEPEPFKVSPKIVALFDDVKEDYLGIIANYRQTELRDSLARLGIGYGDRNLKGALFRSVVLPGWGHLYERNKTKGWLFLSAGSALLVSGGYYTVKTAQAEQDYLNAVEPDVINQKYEDYNNAYKIRNAILISYAALWIYTQIDLLLLDKPAGSEPDFDLSIGRSPAYDRLDINLSIPFSL